MAQGSNIEISEYDVYFPNINYTHSKCLAKQLKPRQVAPSRAERPSVYYIEQNILKNKANLADFFELFRMKQSERYYVLSLQPVQQSNTFGNFHLIYKATNNLRRCVEYLDNAHQFVTQCLAQQKGKIATLFAKLAELIRQAFLAIELIQEMRKAQQSPVFSDIYLYLRCLDTFSRENTLYLLKIMRNFKIFNIPSDDAQLEERVDSIDCLPLKMLLGVGKLGKLMHVGILRMLSTNCTLNGAGRYYYELLRAEESVVAKYEKYCEMAERDGLRCLTVSCRNQADILDMYPAPDATEQTSSWEPSFESEGAAQHFSTGAPANADSS